MHQYAKAMLPIPSTPKFKSYIRHAIFLHGMDIDRVKTNEPTQVFRGFNIGHQFGLLQGGIAVLFL